MDTYEPKQLISQYATGKLTPEMAVGHCLQHVNKLTETQTAANLSHYRLRSKVDELENVITALQREVACLAGLVEKLRPKKRKPTSSSQSPEA